MDDFIALSLGGLLTLLIIYFADIYIDNKNKK